MRMEKFEYEFVRETGVRVIIGKGGMKENTERACKEFGAIHCVFPAGNAVVAATEVERSRNARDTVALPCQRIRTADRIYRHRRTQPL